MNIHEIDSKVNNVLPLKMETDLRFPKYFHQCKTPEDYVEYIKYNTDPELNIRIYPQNNSEVNSFIQYVQQFQGTIAVILQYEYRDHNSVIIITPDFSIYEYNREDSIIGKYTHDDMIKIFKFVVCLFPFYSFFTFFF